MCDWGGGPNEIWNYYDYSPRKVEPRTIHCQFNVWCEKSCYGKNWKPKRHLHGCNQEIEGFTGSSIYAPYRDPVMEKHLREVEHTRTYEEIAGLFQ